VNVAQAKALIKKENTSVRVIFENETDFDKLIFIGKLRGESNWYGPSAASSEETYKEKALDKLIGVAKEFEADAIVGVDFAVDHVESGDTPGSAPLRRICVTGVAVKYPRS
jgi:uncharacterized protein YbjQ (UPF0145 family)